MGNVSQGIESWWFKRNEEHQQPEVSQKIDLSKYDAYYVDPKCTEKKMERNKLVLDLNKNKEFNYIYKLTEEQIFSKLVNLEQLTFEVTDACNLNCKYCGYGSLYSTHEKRENIFMDFEMAKKIIDYLYNI